MKKIVNFIQFVRGVEPRNPKLDLIKPVVEQVALLQKYNFRGTMLLQYDAMLRPEFQKIAMDTATFQETGLWLEIVAAVSGKRRDCMERQTRLFMGLAQPLRNSCGIYAR